MNQNKNMQAVIVGGGFGGVKTALELANKPGVEVTLISQSTNFEYHGALYRSATGRSPVEVVIPLRTIFKRAKNVRVVLDSAVRVNAQKHVVTGQGGTVYPYHKLVLAMGNISNHFGIKGSEEHTYGMNTIGQTIALRHRLTQLFKKPGASPTVAIVGGGASGVELAGEINQFARMVAHKYGKPMTQPKVVVIEGSDRVLPMLDPVLSAKAYKRLKKLGVHLRLNTKVNMCEPGKVCLDSGDIDADITIWTAGSQVVDFYAKHPKLFKLERGRVVVDEYLRPHGQQSIYVIGDNALTKYSGMAQTALHDACFVARHIMHAGDETKAPVYHPRKPIYSVPVGPGWAVLQSTKHQLSGSGAWLLRRQADRWVFKNFLPYKQAIKQWRRANRLADF